MITVEVQAKVSSGREEEFTNNVIQTWDVLKQQSGFFSAKVYRIEGTTADYRLTQQWKSREEFDTAQSVIQTHPQMVKVKSCLVEEPTVRVFELMASTWDRK